MATGDPDPVPSPDPLFHVVLLHPEIPNNTGNVGRTCAALRCRLHVIHPIGFDMDEKACRRAGLDYWHLIDCREHASFEAFLASERPGRVWLFTARGRRSYFDARFERGDYLLFGKESAGVGPETLDWHARTHGSDAALTIPMPGGDGVRSLNLATSVAIACYEGLRQTGR